MSTLRCVAIADTHGRHEYPVIPNGDLLIHAGDLTTRGTLDDVALFDRFLATLPHRHKVVIAGNHDFCFEDECSRARRLLSNACYLQDEAITVAGLRLWGSPWTPWFYDWAFNLRRGAPLRACWEQIPGDTDILITHGPPHGFLDFSMNREHAGCEELRAAVERICPRFHIFGHIHEGAGVIEEGPTTFINASICNARYQPHNPPVTFDIEV